MQTSGENAASNTAALAGCATRNFHALPALEVVAPYHLSTVNITTALQDTGYLHDWSNVRETSESGFDVYPH